MAKRKKIENKVLVVEFHIWMHCNGCERTVAKAISKIKGVEKFMTDMIHHRVVITGRINPDKVIKKLKKETGKRVEILSTKEEQKDVVTNVGEEDSTSECSTQKQVLVNSLIFDYVGDNEVYMTFNDENPNACIIM